MKLEATADQPVICVFLYYRGVCCPKRRQVGIVQKGDCPVAGYRDVVLFGDD